MILRGVGAPVTRENVRFLNAWARAEGGSAANNPFNTTQHAPGAGTYNSVGVRSYLSPQQGIQATVQTLRNGRYGNILSALHAGNDAGAAARALAASPWGTGSLVEKILGSGGPVGPPAPSSVPGPASVMAPPRPQPRPDLTNLFNLGNQMFDLAPLPAGALAPLPPAQGLQGRAGVATRPAMNRPVTATPAPPKHGSTLNFIEHFAAPFGLTITSTTGGKHAPHSYHYQGRAVDFGGDPTRMAALAQAALKHPQDFKEMFYAGPGNPGFFIKNGRVYPNSQLDPGLAAEHRNHVHVAS